VRDRDTLDKLGTSAMPPWMDFENGQPVLSTDLPAKLQHA
jgi:glucose-1-phosphate cytidylyltransferase